jgi:methylated-DNA-[protein]-cysteine S-methyltransferase
VSKELRSFAPVIDPDTRILILGTMPSIISLQKGEYYANPRNNFWRIVFAVFDRPQGLEQSPGYAEKIGFLRQNRIGLWDVLRECEREGSGDSEINGGVSNDLLELTSIYRNVRCICFNGQKARKLFFRSNDERSFTDVNFISLPSTSPANAGMPFNEKVEKWRAIRNV